MNPLTIHQLKQHLSFFAGIPPRYWCTDHLNWETDRGVMKHCAIGHLYALAGQKKPDGSLITRTELGKQVDQINLAINDVSFGYALSGINDGDDEKIVEKFGKTPKTRVLNVLKAAMGIPQKKS